MIAVVLPEKPKRFRYAGKVQKVAKAARATDDEKALPKKGSKKAVAE